MPKAAGSSERMHVKGYNKRPDWPKLGPSVVVGACVILAIRTARWDPRAAGTTSDPELDKELEHACYLAGRVLGHLLSRKEGLFPQVDEPWYEPDESSSPA